MPVPSLQAAIARYGAEVKRKLSNPAAAGAPEDQLRAPLERLLADIAGLCRFSAGQVVAVGESSLAELKTRPDYAVTVRNALVGFIEVKAPGKGAEPRRFRNPHDKEQWERLKSLPNIIYTDGGSFSLWHSGELDGAVIHLEGELERAGASLTAPPALQTLFEDFLRWQPIAPRSVRELAETTARLCRLLRDEVVEQMSLGSQPLTELATDWRRLLFPDASDERFADGYAQAVTFGLLVARARGLELRGGLDAVARGLGRTDSLIGTALRLLTDSAENQKTLQTSIGTLVRVLDEVEWSILSHGDADAWLYFYEQFLEVYDSKLRKQTGSYYTPPEVVSAMVRLVDDALRTRFGRTEGLGASNVMIADPAVGTGTFLLGVLRHIATAVESSDGAGAVPAAIDSAIKRLLAFEIQLGPYAVAQLRIVAELALLSGEVPHEALRMFVTDTLANPWIEQERLGAMYEPIAESRRRANRIKREEPITVVIGNPPYKEKARGMGGWVEAGGANHPAPLLDWMPPPDWGVSAHAKHLRNLYVYFWRWATWKVFDHDPEANRGIVCFITVAGFLNGPGFVRMRDDLRRKADEIWIIDCSPEGHQPEVNTRIFQGVQQPVCIMLASRSPLSSPDTPATVRYRALPEGHRDGKFAALSALTLDAPGWRDCPSDWRAPFLPSAAGAWADFPALDRFFEYNGSGVMPGRTWVIAPDVESLERRWETLQRAPEGERERLFHPHQQRGGLGDRHVARLVAANLHGHPHRAVAVKDDEGPVAAAVRYGFRSFDRQWIIADNRVINRANPTLWEAHSDRQVYLTALERTSPTDGPGFAITACIPDLDHYNGRGGRVFPGWRDSACTQSNVPATLCALLAARYQREVSGQDVVAYLAAVAAHPAYTERFARDLVRPGLRVPLTADASMFTEAVELGRRVIWLQTYGERCADAAAGRPAGAPRAVAGSAPAIPRAGSISSEPDAFPDRMEYDAAARRLAVGTGYVDHVEPAVWAYTVSGKHVVKQWFSYRRKSRERPLIGDRRPPSPLGDIQPERWPHEYTNELIDLLNVLTLVVQMEPGQRELLERICAGPLIGAADVEVAVANSEMVSTPARRHDPHQTSLLE